MKHIFIVDDDFDIILSLSKWLQRKRFAVEGFSNSKEMFIALEHRIPDTILLDVGLGTEDGRDVCKAIRKQFGDKIPIVLFSMKYNTLKELHDSCADDYIKKDSTLREITSLLHLHMNIEKE